jgi:hypothetical protein
LLKGRLTVTVLERMPGRLAVFYRLERPELSLDVDGGRAATQEAVTVSVLSRGIFAELDVQGRVRSLYFDPGTDGFSRNFFRALLAHTQFVVTEPQGRRWGRAGPFRWEIEEEDPNGPCLTRYERLTPVGGQAMFSKAKLAYVRPHAEAGPASLGVGDLRRVAGSGMRPMPTEVRPTGMMKAVFDEDKGRLLSLEGTESQEISAAGKAFARSRSSFKMRLLETVPVPREVLLAGRRGFSERRSSTDARGLSFELTEDEGQAAIERSELGTATKESLLSDLAAAEAEGRESDTGLSLKFKALVELHPEVCPELGRILAVAEPGRVTLNVLSMALGSAGHVQAQDALIEAVQAGLAGAEDSEKLRFLIECLGMVPHPTERTEDVLREAAESVGKPRAKETALMLLGNMARNLETVSPRRAARIVDWLLGEIGKEPGGGGPTRRTQVLLLSLGNSGSKRAQNALMGFMSSPDTGLRATAAAGLRWIRSPEADERLIEALLNDEAPAVRVEAVFALSFRDVGGRVLEAAKLAFLRDQADEVRLTVLRSILARAIDRPDVRRLVEQAADGDRSKDVRKAAADILGPAPRQNISRDEEKSRLPDIPERAQSLDLFLIQRNIVLPVEFFRQRLMFYELIFQELGVFLDQAGTSLVQASETLRVVP